MAVDEPKASKPGSIPARARPRGKPGLLHVVPPELSLLYSHLRQHPVESVCRVRVGLPANYFTVTETACEGIPFATTSSFPAPVSMPDGTSKLVETVVLPVATPIVLWSWVRA